jgi:DNA recombination protein RmuC
MPPLSPLLVAAIAAAVSALLTFLVFRLVAERGRAALVAKAAGLEATVRSRDEEIGRGQSREDELATTLAALRDRSTALERHAARLDAELRREREGAAEKLELLTRAEARLKETFDSLSAAALRSNNESFLALARTQMVQAQQASRADLDQRRQAIDALVQPIAQTLTAVNGRIEQVERSRIAADGALGRHLEEMREMHTRLQGETANLVKALRAPAVRGRWGEIQLQRVVELAGMLEHCDFVRQETVQGEDGRLRPDLIVRLPNGRSVAVDSKVPLSHYLEALEAADEDARVAALRRHAAQVRTHVRELSAKAYQDAIEPSPEFVVLFLPGETFFSAALEQDPSLIEAGVEMKVILATPTTLIGLLKAVAYGWRQEALAENAREISRHGRLLYERLAKLAEHFAKVGRGLEQATDAYNRAVGSLESRVLPAARELKRLGAATGDDIPVLPGVERTARVIVAPELAATSTVSITSITSIADVASTVSATPSASTASVMDGAPAVGALAAG